MRPRVVELLDLAFLALQLREIDRPAINAWRSSGLESSNGQSCLLELFGEMRSCAFPSAAAGEPGVGTDVDASAEESAGGDDDCSRTEAPSLEGLHADYAFSVLGKQKPGDGSLHSTQLFMLFEEGSDRAPVEAPITLSAWRPNRRTLAAVEHAELERGEIRCPPHYSAERIHLAYDSSLGNSTDRGVAGHLADGFERAGDEPDPRSQASCCDRGFRSGVTGTDDNYIELGLEILRLGHTLKISITTYTTQLVSNRT
jgi:hypothetical protein